jgi:hypothetical protein
MASLKRAAYLSGSTADNASASRPLMTLTPRSNFLLKFHSCSKSMIPTTYTQRSSAPEDPKPRMPCL